MASWFCDTNLGGGNDDGTSWDVDAWLSIEKAMEWNGFAPGDKTWIRRTSSYLCADGDIAPTDDGTAKDPLYFIGWPRAAIPNTTITGADFTNGSNIVDNVAGIIPDREKHIGRYITAPDGEQYLITAVLWEADVDGMGGGDEFTVGSKLTNVTQTKYGKLWAFTDNLDATGTIQYVRDSTSAWVNNDNITDADGGDAEIDAGGETAVGFLIDREYPGGTVAGVAGKFQIEADEDYATRPDIGGLRAAWDADADDLPVIDFNNHASNLNVTNDRFFSFANLEFRDSLHGTGLIYTNESGALRIKGCLLHQDQNTEVMTFVKATVYILRTIIEGNGTGGSQVGISFSYALLDLRDVAIYNLGASGLNPATGASVYLENVNIGIEVMNGSTDIYSSLDAHIRGRDVELGGTNGDVLWATGGSSLKSVISLENYGKTLAAHKIFNPLGETNKVTAGAGGDIANQRGGGAANLIEINYNINFLQQQPVPDWCPPVFVHEFEATTDSLSYRYYVQSMAIVTAAQLWIEVEYVSGYDDASEYVLDTQVSDEAFTVRANANDWAEFMEVTAIVPAVASKVRIKCYCSFFHAADKIYIDPMVVIS